MYNIHALKYVIFIKICILYICIYIYIIYIYIYIIYIYIYIYIYGCLKKVLNIFLNQIIDLLQLWLILIHYQTQNLADTV